MVKIFVVGATGYQGSTLIQKLLENGDKHDITALVRSEKSGEALREKGVKTVTGDLSSTPVLQQGAQEADVVFSLASADHLEPVQTLVNALKPRGKKAVLIHTSGTSVLADQSKSEFTSDTVYSDSELEKVASLPESQMHKNVDDWIRHNAQDICYAIVCPPTIYGVAGDPKRTSVQIPLIAKGMLGTKRAALIGKGEGMWNYVHVADLADFYVLLMSTLLEQGPGKAQELGGYYFCEAGSFKWRQLFQAVADRLQERGKLDSAELQGQFSEDEMEQHMMGPTTWGVVGNNARCSSDRARKLGWQAQRPGLLQCAPGDVDSFLATL